MVRLEDVLSVLAANRSIVAHTLTMEVWETSYETL